jgi:NAD(P)-dependent dehydrogenase (short-subunit alcohol dehydrogenase family)
MPPKARRSRSLRATASCPRRPPPNSGSDHLGFACDVSKDAEVKSAIDRVLVHYGKLDAIHNNAGIATPSKPLHETTDGEWDALFNINLKSVLHTTRHGIAALREAKGCILNTSSSLASSARKSTPSTPPRRA